MARKLAGFMIDCSQGTLAQARGFWSGTLGLPVLDPDEGGDGRYALLGAAAGAWHVEVQMVEHEARLHLDIEADDIDAESELLAALGAVRVANPHGRWWVMQAPSGHRYCVVRKRDPETATPPVTSNPAGHRSALVALVIDCNGDLEPALAFWSTAFGRAVADADQDGDGKYAELATAADELFLLLQRVDHAPRVHLDIETDDLDAEVARLEALGATRVEFRRRWWVMQAPTGHRFCVVRQQPAKAALPMNAWPVGAA